MWTVETWLVYRKQELVRERAEMGRKDGEEGHCDHIEEMETPFLAHIASYLGRRISAIPDGV